MLSLQPWSRSHSRSLVFFRSLEKPCPRMRTEGRSVVWERLALRRGRHHLESVAIRRTRCAAAVARRPTTFRSPRGEKQLEPYLPLCSR
ncbi:unnamed protein product [Gulo gulo]|uniref:Uncharacterized protein n=1 Tax=Gulo gulo TaxID=48420 RepID=A0A9X9LJW7_GULGU|nr:unnamed protein product [Gulo gulo]